MDPIGLLLRVASPLYAMHLAHRCLDGVYVRGLPEARALIASEPVILAANHVCWWDGQIMLVIHRALRAKAKFLVSADNVERMSYLTQIGGVPIDRSSMNSAIEALQDGAAWLDGPGKTMWLFPQGRFRPTDVRPLGLERGVGLLQKWSGATVLPVSLHYGYRDNHLPTCVVSFGEPLRGRERLMERLDAALTAELDATRAWHDDPERKELAPLVKSWVVPVEDRLGSQVYLAMAWVVRTVIGGVRGLIEGPKR